VLVIERWFRGTTLKAWFSNALPRGTPWLGRAWMLLLVIAGWIFFRSRSFADAMETFRSFAHPGTLSYGTFNMLGLSAFQILGLVLSLIILFAVDFQLDFHPERLARLRRVRAVSTVAGVGLVYYVFLFGVFGRTDFIYFQF
jgi:alginate O-acetyltransferase complex protein AlgI